VVVGKKKWSEKQLKILFTTKIVLYKKIMVVEKKNNYMSIKLDKIKKKLYYTKVVLRVKKKKSS